MSQWHHGQTFFVVVFFFIYLLFTRKRWQRVVWEQPLWRRNCVHRGRVEVYCGNMSNRYTLKKRLSVTIDCSGLFLGRVFKVKTCQTEC